MGSVTYSVQIVSTPHFCLKAVSLEQLLEAGKANIEHITKHKGVGEEPSVTWVQLKGPTCGSVFLMTFMFRMKRSQSDLALVPSL